MLYLLRRLTAVFLLYYFFFYPNANANGEDLCPNLLGSTTTLERGEEKL
jgi:hypothetical protein